MATLGWQLSVLVAQASSRLEAHVVGEDWNGFGWYAQHAYGERAALRGAPTRWQTVELFRAMEAREPLPAWLLADQQDPAAVPPPVPSSRRREVPLTARQRAAVVAAYQAGRSAEAVAGEFGVSHQAVVNLARKAGVAVRSNREYKVPAMEREAIAVAYESGESLVSLAERYAIAQSTVAEIVREAGVAVRTRGKRLDGEQRAAVAAAYASGRPSPQIAEEYGISKQTVLAIVRELGGVVR